MDPQLLAYIIWYKIKDYNRPCQSPGGLISLPIVSDWDRYQNKSYNVMWRGRNLGAQQRRVSIFTAKCKAALMKRPLFEVWKSWSNDLWKTKNRYEWLVTLKQVPNLKAEVKSWTVKVEPCGTPCLILPHVYSQCDTLTKQPLLSCSKRFTSRLVAQQKKKKVRHIRLVTLKRVP
jgi:hypothetical protein